MDAFKVFLFMQNGALQIAMYRFMLSNIYLALREVLDVVIESSCSNYCSMMDNDQRWFLFSVILLLA